MDLEWEKLGFAYQPTDFRFVANYRGGAWEEGTLSSDPNVVLNESACVDALVVPVPGGILTFLKQEKEGCMVPWNRILRIGDDVILVELHEDVTAGCD